MALTTAMAEDDLLVEAAGWARYYERANELIQQAKGAMVGESPPQEVVDDPETFRRWLEQCDRIYLSRMSE